MEALAKKELLYYLLFTEGDKKLAEDRCNFKKSLGLSDTELSELKMSAANTRVLVSYADYSAQDVAKRNQEVAKILENGVRQVDLILADKKEQYEAWMKEWWDAEKKYRTDDINGFNATTSKSSVSVYATQYNAETSNEVALPDKYVKFATRGWTSDIPEDLQNTYSGEYKVKVTNGKTSKSSIPVYDVGPWNTNDNYWDSATASNPRREFTDLAQYTPEAYAAFYNDYNDGKDSRGRTVTNPAGIDLCLTVAKALGFSSNASGWVTVDMSSLP